MRIAMMSFAHLHGDAYLQHLRAISDVDVVGLADGNVERGQYYAQEFGLQYFDSYEELLKEELNGVVICSENTNHHDLVLMAAQAGVNILCEKPLATSVDNAREMVQACDDAGVKLMTAFPMRFNAPVLEAKKAIESAGLGRIYGANTTNQGALPIYHVTENPHFHQWFVDKQLAGGGALTDHIVHVADLLRWYLGEEVVEVYATANTILYADKVDVETAGVVMLTFESGTFASIDCSWSKPPNYPTWGGLTMELVGENGLVTVDAFKQTSTVYSGYNNNGQWAYWGSDANQSMIKEFTDAIRENRSPSITGYDGYKATEIVAAAYQSVASGQPVSLT
jgi:predicted dehydrogenase